MKHLISILIVLFFASCADMYGSKIERISKNKSLTAYKLCENWDIAILAPEEVRNEWKQEINRRNINCNNFAAQIADKKLRNQASFESGLEMYVCGQQGGTIYECQTTGADTDWDWDYQPGNNQWACRGIQTGRYATLSKCAYDTKDDDRWPS